MKKRMIKLLASASVVLVAGCVVTPQPTYVYREPPPPRVEYAGYPPVSGYIWISGYWVWGGHGYEWLPGRWEAPRPGYRWVAPRWERAGDRWYQHEGRWDRDPAWHGPATPPPAMSPRYDRESPRVEPMPRRDYDGDRSGQPRFEREAPKPQVVQPPRPPEPQQAPRGFERREPLPQYQAPKREDSRSRDRRDEGRDDERSRGRPDFRRDRGDDR